MSGEHLLLFGVVLLIFGPKRLPELGNTLGKAIRNFKDAVSGTEDVKLQHPSDDIQPPVSTKSRSHTLQFNQTAGSYSDVFNPESTTQKVQDSTLKQDVN